MNVRTRTWEPPESIDRDAVIASSRAVLAMQSIPITEREDVFRIATLGLDWDIGVQVYEPTGEIARGADGKKVGCFLMHGGSGDYKSIEKFARLFAEKFRFKVVSMTFPGRLNLDDPARDWPGDTIGSDGSVRTPIWLSGEHIGREEYDVVRDQSNRVKYGTRTLARAKPGTRFYDRMAAWPAAFEDGMKEACRRHFPSGEFSIYAHGHSTGGPFVALLSQRVDNLAGVLALEMSIFGYIMVAKEKWAGGLGVHDPFTDLYIRTWRDLARYRGPEALGQEGAQALNRLPWLMEEVHDAWDAGKSRPQFKAEYIVTEAVAPSLEEAARACALRLKLDRAGTQSLIDRYLGYGRELSGPNVKPLPPFLFAIAKDSRDNPAPAYEAVILPMLREIQPAPKLALTRFGAGVHVYVKPENDLPIGIAPAAAQLYHDAIVNGFFDV
jgi:hypothetical protein